MSVTPPFAAAVACSSAATLPASVNRVLLTTLSGCPRRGGTAPRIQPEIGSQICCPDQDQGWRAIATTPRVVPASQ